MDDLPQERPGPPPDSDADVAAPPAMPVRATLYIHPDGSVSVGALFDELVPLARALDPDLARSQPARGAGEP